MNRPTAILASTVLAGSAAWQAPVNARLGRSIGVMPASVTSFVVSVLFLLAVALVAVGPRMVLSLPLALRGVPPSHLSGGLIGSTYVLVALLTVDRLGTGGLIAGSVAGTLVGAVCIDWAGLLGVPRVVPGGERVAGVVALIAGTLLLDGGGERELAPLPLVAIFGAGVLVAFQPPVNARLATRVGGARAALTQSSVGLIALSVATALGGAVSGWGGNGGGVPWWSWTGGLLGALYVVSTLLSVPAIGAGGVAAASIAGGLAFGVVADALGLFGLDRVAIDPIMALGLVLLASGAALVLRRQRPVP